ncbi:MAG: hypothetical protein AAGF11_34900 [Myxococcota bacterium]
MARTRRAPPLVALAALGCALACGRSPVWLPCGPQIADDDVPSPTCEHPSCPSSNVAQLALPPSNALIVLDRSCSMVVLIDGRTKWSRAVEAIVGVLADPLSQSLRWGLTLFPDGDTDGIQAPPLIPVAPEQSAQVAQLLLDALEPTNEHYPRQPGEPCFTDLVVVTELLTNTDVFGEVDGQGHVIFITDGLAEGLGRVTENLELLFERGVPTFVVGFGEQVNTSALQQMGEAGGVPASAQTAYYRAGLDDLGRALRQVVQSLGCRHALRLRPEDVGRMMVRTDDGQVVPEDPQGIDGWRYDEQTESLLFAGAACEQLLAGEITTIELRLDCQ